MPSIDFKPQKVTERKKASAEEMDKEAFDYRHPLYVGAWKRSLPGKQEGATMDDLDEPHVKRRHVILAKHPEIKELYGPVTSTKWITLGLVSAQVTLAYVFGTLYPSHNWTMVATAYVIGATITAVMGVVIHEVTHGLCFKSLFMNRMLGLVANIPLPFPIAMSFRRYHLEHHAFQGVVGKDPDLPLDFEVNLVKKNPLAKLVFLFFFPVMYVVRGAALKKSPSFWEIVNWVVTITTNVLVYNFCGPKGLLYLFLSTWFGYGIHVGAAHFIQEHYTFIDGQETYSYYGSMNKLTMNIGYHNEHHDFTQVPWSNLPKVRAIAPEFYDTLYYHTSWFRVIYEFLFNGEVSPQSRVVRDYKTHRAGRRLITKKSFSDKQE